MKFLGSLLSRLPEYLLNYFTSLKNSYLKAGGHAKCA